MATIVYVNALGGPPFDYVIGKLGAWGEVHVVQPEPMSPVEEARLRAVASSVTFTTPDDGGLESFLMRFVHDVAADVVLTFDEFSVIDVSAVAEASGLRGPGPNAARSVRKQDMYEVLDRCGVLRRRFTVSRDLEALISPLDPLPYVIKPSQCAGSLGVFGVRSAVEHAAVRERVQAAEASVRQLSASMDIGTDLDQQPWIREELLVGDADAWFGEDTRYADYISVEGVILGGRYHPLAVTQNFPLLEPFIETVSITPSTLPIAEQSRLARGITPAIEALQLGDCGTHTEIKLMAGGEFAVIETAARFAGWNIVPQIESVFGIDPIGILVAHLLGQARDTPPTLEQIHARRARCAATLNLLPITPEGVPWGPVTFEHEPVLTDLLDPSTAYEFTSYVAPGSGLGSFNSADGAWNSFGKVFLEAGDPSTLNGDIDLLRRSLRDLIS